MNTKGEISAIVTQAFAKEDIHVNYEFLPWTRAIAATQDGEYNGVFPGYYVEERKDKFYFSDQISAIPVGFVGLKKNEVQFDLKEKNLTKLYDNFKTKNYKIGVIKSYFNEPLFDKREDLNKVVFGAEEQALKALVEGKIDMYFADNTVYKTFIARNYPEAKDEVVFFDPPILNKGLFLMFPKKDPKSKYLQEKFNSGLKKLK